MSNNPPSPPGRSSGYQRFLAELKRRKVFKVAAVYGVVAFVVLQVADLVLPTLGIPEWGMPLVLVLILLGFPIALVFAWAFETTPGGVKRTEEAASGEITQIISMPASRRWPSGIAALVGVGLLVFGAWWVGRRSSAGADAVGAGSEQGVTAVARRAEGDRVYSSIAVLSFTNLSADQENEYFGDGLAEELLNALAGIDGLKVAARTSAFAFKGRDTDVRAIGDTLAVETVLEGSVRRSGDRLRITAQLIDTEDGYHIWSQTYDRELTDIFAVQDELAAAIVEALSVPLGTEEAANLYRGGTNDVAAFELYLTGRQKWVTRDTALLREAIADFEAAIARDSSYALAWSGYADAVDGLAWRDATARRLVPSGKAAARRALELVPDLAEAHASLAVLVAEFDRDYETAEAEYRRAIELKPSYAQARTWFGDLLLLLGRVPEAIEQYRIGAELDPLAWLSQNQYASALRRAGRLEEAMAQYRKAEVLATLVGQQTVTLQLLWTGQQLGLGETDLLPYAESLMQTTQGLAPEEYRQLVRAIVDPELRAEVLSFVPKLRTKTGYEWSLALVYAMLGDDEAVMTILESMHASGDVVLPLALPDPAFDRLRDDPRLIRIVDDLGLPRSFPAERSDAR